MDASEFATAQTTADLVRLLTRRFRDSRVETPERDARLLVAAAAGLDPAYVLIEQRIVDDDVRGRIAAYGARRLGSEPVSRILGRRGFYGREFIVTPDTLDPRADTETVVEAALAIATREGWRQRPIRIVDVGTGTGAILLTLLAELPLASGLGTDISGAALAVARRNAQNLGLAERTAFMVTRSLEGVAGPFDLLVSNPPYIASSEIAGLAPEVRDHDPRLALDGGGDGLDIYREILGGVRDVVPDGWACLEFGAGQADAVVQIAADARLPVARRSAVFRDLGGHERCVALRTQL